jgi:hypothetical protein
MLSARAAEAPEWMVEMEEIVYVGVASSEGARWWRYAHGTLQSMAFARGDRVDAIALAILSDFAALDPSALQRDAAGELAAAFSVQFLAQPGGMQAQFVEEHRIRMWLRVQRMCGRA